MKNLLLTALIVLMVFAFGCDTENPDTSELVTEKKAPVTALSDVDISITLGHVSCLTNSNESAVAITVQNNGDTDIRKLEGDIVLYNSANQEICRLNKLLIIKHPGRAKIVGNDGTIKYTPLPPKQAYTKNFTFAEFFVGHPDLRDNAQANWETLTAKFEPVTILM